MSESRRVWLKRVIAAVEVLARDWMLNVLYRKHRNNGFLCTTKEFERKKKKSSEVVRWIYAQRDSESRRTDENKE